MAETVYVVVGGLVAGLSAGGLMSAVVLYLLKNKVGRDEAVLCQAGIKQQIADKHTEAQLGRDQIVKQMDRDRDRSDTNHESNNKELRLIRKGLAYAVAKQWGKEDKIKEWSGKDASMIVNGIMDDLNGD